MYAGKFSSPDGVTLASRLLFCACRNCGIDADSSRSAEVADWACSDWYLVKTWLSESCEYSGLIHGYAFVKASSSGWMTCVGVFPYIVHPCSLCDWVIRVLTGTGAAADDAGAAVGVAEEQAATAQTSATA